MREAGGGVVPGGNEDTERQGQNLVLEERCNG